MRRVKARFGISSGRTDFCCLGHFDKRTGFYIVEIAVDRDGWRHKRVRANPPHIGDNARMSVSDREPIDELASVGAWPAPRSCQPSESITACSKLRDSRPRMISSVNVSIPQSV